jgi:hypothetical protein
MVCRYRREVERLGLVLRIRGRWWALLLLLHDADLFRVTTNSEATTPQTCFSSSTLRKTAATVRDIRLDCRNAVAIDTDPNNATEEDARSGRALRGCAVGGIGVRIGYDECLSGETIVNSTSTSHGKSLEVGRRDGFCCCIDGLRKVRRRCRPVGSKLGASDNGAEIHMLSHALKSHTTNATHASWRLSCSVYQPLPP